MVGVVRKNGLALGVTAVLGALGLTACGGGGGSSSDEAPKSLGSTPVSIEFAAMVADQVLACDTDYTGVGTAGSMVQVKDFRMFVHEVELLTDGGKSVSVSLEDSPWQAQGVVLLDFEDGTGECTGTAETNRIITGTVPDSGDVYTGVRFVVGIPESLNHLEQASVSPFNVTGMNWGWTNGFKFIRFDIPNWNVHIGATGCVADGNGDVQCSQANRPQIELDNFDFQTQHIRIDYAALVQDNNVSTDTGGAVGCMSGGTDPECNGVFTQLGLNLASGDNDPALAQTVFSVSN
ncbi:MAG: MbnP family copper-binding protein [Pseudomonadota bacterium]|nr:MbnP family copper-binding protein [Pseudomonadota bacterium]